MNTLDYIVKKYNIDTKAPSPIDIPNVGRDHLPELFRELGFKLGAEIGVERGVYAEQLCKANDNLQLYCVDPWITYQGYELYGEMMVSNYQETQERLRKYKCTIIRKFSMDAVKDFEDGSLDFVYIDGNHNFQSVVNDLSEWTRKVRVGGIISGHDFYRRRSEDRAPADSIPPHAAIQVAEAVIGFTQAFAIKPWFALGNRWPQPGEIRDKRRSFMWVRGKYA